MCIRDRIKVQSPEFAAAVKEIRVETEGSDLAFTIESLLSTIEAKRAVIGAGTLNGLDSIGFSDLANLVKTNVVTLVSVHDHLLPEERTKLAHAQLASWISKARRRYPSEIFTTNSITFLKSLSKTQEYRISTAFREVMSHFFALKQ